MEKRNKLLLVDDDASCLLEYIGILKKDYELSTAKSGQAAIDRAEKAQPDLIVLDVIMPEMNGFDVIIKLKESDLTKDIPVVFASGAESNEDERRGLELGAIDYIRKPIDETIVSLRIKNHIDNINLLRDKDAVIDDLSSR